MTKTGTLLASAAAAAFAFSAGTALADHHEAKGDKVHCEGVNACKGNGECKTASNECGGLNSCKGKGWVSMTADECEAAKKAAES